MPQDFKKYASPSQDGRRKLLRSQHADVRAHYVLSQSQRKTAKHFEVSRRLIVFILHPERLQAMQDKHREEEHWKTFYDKEEHTKAIKKYRDKKRSLGLAFTTNRKPNEKIHTAET